MGEIFKYECEDEDEKEKTLIFQDISIGELFIDMSSMIVSIKLNEEQCADLFMVYRNFPMQISLTSRLWRPISNSRLKRVKINKLELEIED